MAKIKKKSSEKKKVWNKKAYAEYFKESRELSDYSCSKRGITENKYSKKYKDSF